MNFWETKEWIEAKTFILKTDKLLSRLDYLKHVGYKNYSEEKYQKYLEVMTKKVYKNETEIFTNS
jgi:hypothetical protein